MNIISTVGMSRCEALVEGLRAELGGVLAERAIEAEAADFLWEGRMREHYLGQHIDAIYDEESSLEEVSRIAFLSFLDGRWHAGICLVDGEGAAVDLLWKLSFQDCEEAEIAFARAR
jgi:hypothetical protein